jgi:hypothetical protein
LYKIKGGGVPRAGLNALNQEEPIDREKEGLGCQKPGDALIN